MVYAQEQFEVLPAVEHQPTQLIAMECKAESE